MIGKKINQLATELAPVSTDLTIIGNPTTGVSKKITLAQLGAIFSGAVSFYTNLAAFPTPGTTDVIYCAKDTQKLYLWSGSAYVEVFPSQALLNTYQLRSEKGVSNGYASLDSTGKVPISQLPSSIMEYKGTWNAATNTPTLANGTGDTGDVYICNVAGTVNFGAGAITFAVGDYVIYSGSIWQRSSGAVGTVTSVAASITGNAIGITGSPVTTSGTLAFAFAGTGAQYIKGDGTLATFPNTIAQATNLITEVYNSTGATLTKGTIVYINGGQGNLPTVTKALATGDSTSAQTFGVVQADITNMNNGYVVVAGKLSDLDTQAYTPGTQLYLSSTTAGTWTSTKQYAPNHLVYIGIVVRAHPTQGIVEVKIQNGYELDELHNVAAQTPTNNDGLFWESSTSLWKNKSIATVLGYTPQPQLSGTGFVKISGTTISYDNSTYLTTSAASSTYLPLVLNGSANTVDINGQQFTIQGSAGGFTSGRIIVDPVFSAIGYQVSGVFNGLKILTNGNADFTNSGVTRFFNQVRFDSTLTDGTYTYTLPGATGTIALVGGAGVGTVTSVGLSSATSGVTIGSTPVTTSGTITLAIATASGSQQGLLSSTDWTTFNNKQNALTNPVTGTGTTNYLPKFTGTSTIGNSQIFDTGSEVRIFTTSTDARNFTLGVYGVTWDNTLLEIANDVTVFNKTSADNGSLIEFRTVGGQRGDIRASTTSFTVSSRTSLILGSNNTNQVTLDTSGNLGLGVTPTDGYGGLQIVGPTSGNILTQLGIDGVRAGVRSSGNTAIVLDSSNTTFTNRMWYLYNAGASGSLIIGRPGLDVLTFSNGGNLGLGVTPSAWSNNGNLDLQDVYLSLSSQGAYGGTISNNAYYNAGWKYKGANYATQYQTLAGEHRWLTAGVGAAAGNAISFTQAMTLDANGRLGIGATSMTYALQVNDVAGGNMFRFASGSTVLDYYVSGGNPSFGTASNNDLRFRTNDTTRLTIASTGAATFSNALQVAGQQAAANYGGTGLNFDFTSGNIGRIASVKTTSGGSQLQFLVYNTSGTDVNALQIASTGAATFSSSVTAGAFITNAASGTGSQEGLRIINDNGYIGFFNGANSTRSGYLQGNTTDVTLTTSPSTPLILGTANTERMRIGSTGNVAIGSTNTSDWRLRVVGDHPSGMAVLGVQAASGTVSSIGIFNSAGTRKLLFYTDNSVGGIETASDPLVLGTSGTERMRITSGGNVGIGTTSPASALDVNGQTLIRAMNGGALGLVGTDTLNTNWGITWYTTTYTGGVAAIRVARRGASDASDMMFYTAPNGDIPSERMRITSGGFLKLREAVTSTTSVHILQADTTSDAVVQVRNLNASNGSDGMLAVVAQRNTTNNSFYAFGYYNLDAGAWRLRIADSGNVTNTNNSYGAISDISLKENISDTTSKLADLLKVKVRNYNLIGDDKKQIGVIAQELETIFPSMIDTDVNTGLKSVKYSVFVPMLIKGMQELKAELDTLKNK